MTEIEIITTEIHGFVSGNMDWDAALTLVITIAESEELIDYLLMKMELYECSVSFN